MKTLQPLIDAKLPGTYVDTSGALCVMIGPYLISCKVDTDDTYLIETDRLNSQDDFGLCIRTASAPCYKTAIQEFRWAIRKTYTDAFGKGDRT
ncbi:MAG: hypothetical protein HDQ88_08245 [Clostridia bacterium]|nr:hypothetical protein [Clostridia bacterium]